MTLTQLRIAVAPSQGPASVEFVPSSERALAARRWLELEGRIGDPGLTGCWAWIATWLAHFGDDIPHVFAFGLRDGQTIGAALLTQAPLQIGPFPVPALFVGTGGEARSELTYVQYNRLLVAPEDLDDFATGLMAALVGLKWSVLRLNGFAPEHAEALVRAGQAQGLSFQVESVPSPAFDLRKLGPDQDVLAGLTRDTRSKLKRSMRFLTERLGEPRLEWAQTAEQACDILDELIMLHTEQWNARGEPGSFATDRLQKYHEDLIDALFPEHVILFRVKQGDTTIGCLYNLVEGTRVTNHRSGIRFFPDDNRLKPGYVTDIYFMEEARKRGYEEYDLLVGHEYYKRLITNSENRLMWAVSGRGLGARCFDLARKLYWHPRLGQAIRRAERGFSGVLQHARRAA